VPVCALCAWAQHVPLTEKTAVAGHCAQILEFFSLMEVMRFEITKEYNFAKEMETRSAPTAPTCSPDLDQNRNRNSIVCGRVSDECCRADSIRRSLRVPIPCSVCGLVGELWTPWGSPNEAAMGPSGPCSMCPAAPLVLEYSTECVRYAQLRVLGVGPGPGVRCCSFNWHGVPAITKIVTHPIFLRSTEAAPIVSLALAASAPRSGLTPPHLRRDLGSPRHICAGIWAHPATSAPGLVTAC
jgi:hypothetical protein